MIQARELMRVQSKMRNVKHDLQQKNEIIENASRECEDAFVQLTNFTKLYEVVKTERNKFVSCFNLI